MLNLNVQVLMSPGSRSRPISRGRYFIQVHMPTTVFWPTDVCNSGFCYGWIKPAICVAGVLQKNSVGRFSAFLSMFI